MSLPHRLQKRWHSAHPKWHSEQAIHYYQLTIRINPDVVRASWYPAGFQATLSATDMIVRKCGPNSSQVCLFGTAGLEPPKDKFIFLGEHNDWDHANHGRKRSLIKKFGDFVELRDPQPGEAGGTITRVVLDPACKFMIKNASFIALSWFPTTPAQALSGTSCREHTQSLGTTYVCIASLFR